MRYTWAEFRSYLRLARKRRVQERLESLVSMNRAMAGGESANALQKLLLRELEDADRAG